MGLEERGILDGSQQPWFRQREPEGSQELREERGQGGSSLRCRQMVAAENEGQCFRLNVLYDWGATVSMISEEAVEVMGLATAKQAKRIIKGLGGTTTVSKGTCTLSLVARNGDRKPVTA